MQSFKGDILGRCTLLTKQNEIDRAGLGCRPSQFSEYLVHGEGVPVFKPYMNRLKDGSAVRIQEALWGDGFRHGQGRPVVQPDPGSPELWVG